MERQITDWEKVFADHIHPLNDLYLEYIKNSYNSVIRREKPITMGKIP